jgi:thiol:disulfide interchange protein DsbC
MRKYFSGLLILIPLLAIFIFSNTHCSSASDQKSSSCSQIKKDELLPLLKNLAADIEILEIGDAPFGGLCEIAVETRGRKAIIYTDPSKKYIISGAIIDLTTKANLTQERLTELNKIDVSQIPLDNAILMGDKDAKHRLIVFTDPD